MKTSKNSWLKVSLFRWVYFHFAFIWNWNYWNVQKRNAEFKYIDKIQWFECKYWKGVQIILLGLSEIELHCTFFIRIDYNGNQLFLFWFEGWVILHSVPCYVCIRSFKCKTTRAFSFKWNSSSFFRLPYNSKTPLGYACTMLGMFTTSYASLMINSPLMSFMVGACWLIITFVKDIGNDLYELNTKQARKINREKFKKRFCNIIRQFCVIEQLSELDFLVNKFEN